VLPLGSFPDKTLSNNDWATLVPLVNSCAAEL